MFDFDIKISKRSNENRLILNLPIYFYIIFLILTITILYAITLNGASYFSYFLLLVSVVAFTYTETWVFDKNNRSVLSRSGIGFVFKKTGFSFDDIELIELLTFIKGRNNDNGESSKSPYIKRHYSLKLHLKNGRTRTLLTVVESKKEKLDLILEQIEKITSAKVKR